MKDQTLPEGWKLVKFGEIATNISKRVEPSETELEIYIGLEHLDPDSLKIKRHGVPNDVKGQKLLVEKDQIIFGKRRAYQRKLAIAEQDCICSAHAMVLEENENEVIPVFLAFFMQSDLFMNRAVAISEGSLSPTIKWKILAEQTFKFPNKDTQVVLLDLFQKIESLLNVSIASLEKAKKLKSALLHKLFIENEFSFSIEYKKIADICEYVGRGASPNYSEKETDFVAINQKCIREGSVTVKDSRFHVPSKKLKPTSILCSNDILINSTGTGTLGRAGLWVAPDNKTYFIDTHVTRLSFKKDSQLPLFLLEYFNTSYFQRQLYSECVTGSTNQIELSKTQLNELRVPILDGNELTRAIELISNLNNTLIVAQEKIDSISLLKKSVQQEYWSHNV